jgi:DNA-binding SARP family transcriptional activator
MLAVGFGLQLVTGGPRLPEGLPDLSKVGALLGAAALPLDVVAYALVSLTWLVWLWAIASLALELVLVVIEGVARGAAWVGRLRQLANWVTLPLARRVVAAAFAVQVLSRAVPVAAAPLPAAEQVLTVGLEERAEERERVPASAYVVRPGDTLWSIAERAYASGTEYRRLVAANLGRRMSDGATFTPQGVIQPGWILDVPEPTTWLEHADGARWYTVQRGDTLSAIAAHMLGDRQRWTELYELNRETARLADGRALDDPDLIWPGLRLRLPDQDMPPFIEPPAPETAATDPVLAAGAASAPPLSEPAPPLPARAEWAEPTEIGAMPGADPLPPLVRDVHPVVLTVLDEPELESLGTDADASPAESQLPVDPALGALGLAAAAGLAALGISQVRRLRPLPKEPESEIVVEGGYAAAELANDLARHLAGGHSDPASSLVAQFLRVVDEHDLRGLEVVAVRHGRSSTTLTLTAGLTEQAVLLELAPVLAKRLQAECTAWISTDQDVQVHLTPQRKTRALPPADPPATCVPWLVPLGVLYDRQVFSAAWSTLGHMLVVSLPGHGAETIVTSLLATLTAWRSPDELRLWLVGRPRTFPPPVADLPHLDVIVDPDADDALAGLMARLRSELEQRALGGTWPELVVVVPEMTSLGESTAELQLLLGGAASRGIRVLAGSSDPAAAAVSPLLRSFSTRMVLHLEEEEHSVALLGVADAAFLGGGGRLLLRIDGREPVELYGYQVAPEHLARLVRVMRSAYLSSAPAAPVLAVAETTRPEPLAPIADSSRAIAPDDTSVQVVPSMDEASVQVVPMDEESVQVVPSSDEDAAGLPNGGAPATDRSPDADPPPPNESDATPQVESPLLVDPQAPIHVICFGTPRVMCAGQQVWPRLSRGEAKPWEMLLFLACQPIEGVAREPAVQALWPDDEDFDMTHRVRQLRYRLRGVFNKVDGAPSGDGVGLERNGALYLDHSVIYSDAQEFLELIRRARMFPGAHNISRLERARALYTADLLLGPDVRRYSWVDERDESGVTLREHFRRLFHHATLTLAELYAESGETVAGIHVYHELTELEPSDERVWRALFRLHAARQDGPALIREGRRMRAVLRDLAVHNGEEPLAEACEPDRETQRDYERLLAGLNLREPVPSLR